MKLFSALRDKLDIDVHIIGAPQEETDGAKCKMTDDGIFDDYDIAIMIHMMDYDCADMPFLAMDGNRCRFFGKPSYAAAEPWKGQNALNGAQLMLQVRSDIRNVSRVRPTFHPTIKIAPAGVAVHSRESAQDMKSPE